MSGKKVLIAHQSTIPFYRVPFYQAVERQRPAWWDFTVVYDCAEAQRSFFVDAAEAGFEFPVWGSHTYRVSVRGKRVLIQPFAFSCQAYDLIIVGSALYNLSYPLAYLWRLRGKSVAYWGHGHDYTVSRPHGFKRMSERFKIWLSHCADGFFAYTPGVRAYMVANGIDQRKIYTLYNTIDIAKQRADYEALIADRDALREQAGRRHSKVLLFVGRLTAQKNLAYLFATFSYLWAKDPSYHLMIVGGGDTAQLAQLRAQTSDAAFTYHGAVYDSRLSPLYVMSDAYVFPGAVGLGPLQSLCFDLTPVVIDSPVHKPEYEYLNAENAVIVPRGVACEVYAEAIDGLLNDRLRWARLRSQAWPSIRHLTIEQMAENFIQGVNEILE